MTIDYIMAALLNTFGLFVQPTLTWRKPYVFFQIVDQDVCFIEKCDITFPPAECSGQKQSCRKKRRQIKIKTACEFQLAPEAASTVASRKLMRTGCEWQVKIQTVETGRVLCVWAGVFVLPRALAV